MGDFYHHFDAGHLVGLSSCNPKFSIDHTPQVYDRDSEKINGMINLVTRIDGRTIRTDFLVFYKNTGLETILKGPNFLIGDISFDDNDIIEVKRIRDLQEKIGEKSPEE